MATVTHSESHATSEKASCLLDSRQQHYIKAISNKNNVTDGGLCNCSHVLLSDRSTLWGFGVTIPSPPTVGEGLHSVFWVTIPSSQTVGEGLHPMFGVTIPSPQSVREGLHPVFGVTISSPRTVGDGLHHVFGMTIPSPQTEKVPTPYLEWQFPHLRQKVPTPYLQWQFPHLRQRRHPPHICSDNSLTSDSWRRPPPRIWSDKSLASDREGLQSDNSLTSDSWRGPTTRIWSDNSFTSDREVAQPVFRVTIPSPQTQKAPTLYLEWQFPHLRQSKKASTPYLEWQVPHLKQRRPPPRVWSDNSLTSDNRRRPPPCIWSNKSLTSDSRRRPPPHIWRHSMGQVPSQSFPACWRCSPRALWQGARVARRHASCRSLRRGWLTDTASNPPSSPTLPVLWCHLFLHYWPVPTDLQQRGRFARETKQLEGTIKLSHDRRCLFTPFPPSLISLMVPVDVKHHAYLLKCCLELSSLLAGIYKTHTHL